MGVARKRAASARGLCAGVHAVVDVGDNGRAACPACGRACARERVNGALRLLRGDRVPWHAGPAQDGSVAT